MDAHFGLNRTYFGIYPSSFLPFISKLLTVWHCKSIGTSNDPSDMHVIELGIAGGGSSGFIKVQNARHVVPYGTGEAQSHIPKNPKESDEGTGQVTAISRQIYSFKAVTLEVIYNSKNIRHALFSFHSFEEI